MSGWEPVIGLEIHVQLKTRTKMFCRCETGFGDWSRTRAPARSASRTPARCRCRTRKAIEWTIKLGLALGCEIAPRAVFARKNYFYPDLPKGYQISQYDVPLCVGGRLVVPGPDGEQRDRHRPRPPRGGRGEDRSTSAGRTGASSAPSTRSSTSTAAARRSSRSSPSPTSARPRRRKRFLQLLRQTVVELGISDAEMEKGTLRCDANVSVRPAGSRRAPYPLRAQEHELLQLHRARHRRRDRAPDRASTRRAARSCRRRYDFDAGSRHADRAPLEGGGGGLPLLPRARPRARRAARRAGRARCAASCRSSPGARIARLAPRRSATRRPLELVTSGRDATLREARRRRRRAEGGGERAREPARSGRGRSGSPLTRPSWRS